MKYLISANYQGGEILEGHLIGKQLDDGNFEFVYHHININKEIKAGKCLSKPVLLKNGKIKLVEKWQWLLGDNYYRESEIIEI